MPVSADRFERCVCDAMTRATPRSPTMHRAIDYIGVHFRQAQLTQQEVAHAIGVSRSHLSFLFKREMRVTFREYVKRVRLDAAAARLVDTGDRIKQIWASVGYSYASDFDHHFRSRFGITPSDYRLRGLADGDAVAGLPRRIEGSLNDRLERPAPLQPCRPAAESKKVLIIDDAEGTRDTLGLLLRRSGYEVFTSETAEEGLDFADRFLPDVILLDYHLPGMDGLECLRRLRARAPARQADVLLFTAAWELESRHHEIASLDAAIVSKLTDLDDLASIVAALCARRAANADPAPGE